VQGRELSDAVYDAIVPRALAHVVANAALLAEVEGCIGDLLDQRPDQFHLARIRRDRQQAMRRLEDGRDVAAWQTDMARLDREEREAGAVTMPAVTTEEVASSLADLAGLFTQAEPSAQHRIVQALFQQVEVLGPTQILALPERRG
jgi:hypothetical protein